MLKNYANFFKIIKSDFPDYPKRFLELSDYPKQVYLAGEILPKDELALAVVGSRKMSSYGKDVCNDLVSQISSMGVTIVSGLMYGVDLQAHRCALNSVGRTIGVLGFGINSLERVQDRTIVEEIIGGKGAVLTEFAPDEPGSNWTFPKRDRLISALSSAILVIEAAERSGTSYTVEAALSLGKEVMAVPGSIFSEVSKGTNKMIKDGARVVMGIDDILETLNIEITSKKIAFKSQVEVTEEERAVLTGIGVGEGISVDDLSRSLSLPVSKLSSLLTMLELKGMVKSTGGGSYRRL